MSEASFVSEKGGKKRKKAFLGPENKNKEKPLLAQENERSLFTAETKTKKKKNNYTKKRFKHTIMSGMLMTFVKVTDN